MMSVQARLAIRTILRINWVRDGVMLFLLKLPAMKMVL